MKYKILEKDIVSPIKQYLKMLDARDLLAFTRINVSPVMRGGVINGKRMAKNKDMLGFADFELVANGRVGYMEVKTKHGKLSESQKEFLAHRKKHGAIVKIVRSFNEAEEFIHGEFGVDRI